MRGAPLLRWGVVAVAIVGAVGLIRFGGKHRDLGILAALAALILTRILVVDRPPAA